MPRGISKDADPGLWGWTLRGTPENMGDEPARVLGMNLGSAPKSSLMSIDGVLRVLVLSMDVFPRTLVMATGGASRASRVGTRGALSDSDGNWEGPFFASAGELSSLRIRSPFPNQLKLLQTDRPRDDPAAHTRCDGGCLPSWRPIDPLARDSLCG